ncbi:MAG: acyltransferase [Methylococcales bacterium]|nr:acyltransferase [Methylococcales bacterium]
MNHNNKCISFDLLRGISALLVCAGHIRNFLFVGLGSVTNPSIFDKVFYFATGLGHQAVIVFFVLSGYFVGGSVWKKLSFDQFSWIEYALTRLTRLWMVLIPALLSTLYFDSLGKTVINNVGYDGRWINLLLSGPGIAAKSIDLSLKTFFGNVSFLQTISVPVFGTNGPLWSLANEFWYYVIFPFVAIALHKRSIQSLLILIIVVGCFSRFPAVIYSGFLFWLLGWLAVVITGKFILKIKRWHIVISLVLFLAALVSTKFLTYFISDSVVAASTMILLVTLPFAKFNNRFLMRCASGFSDMSYSLYLFHFPFVAFYWFVFIAPNNRNPCSFLMPNFLPRY